MQDSLPDVHFTLGVRYENVANLDARIIHRWENSYGYIDIGFHTERVRSEHPYFERFDGARIRTSVRAYAGEVPWQEFSGSLHVGTRIAPVFFNIKFAAFTQNHSDIVNNFLVGGAWEIPGVHVMYGYPYAYFRLQRAGILRAAIDIPIIQDWWLGVRASGMAAENDRTFGEALRIMKSWKGIHFDASISFPETTFFDGQTENILVTAGVFLAVFP
jgi:hypothetical protein